MFRKAIFTAACLTAVITTMRNRKGEPARNPLLEKAAGR